ncbi:sugar phosphate isomerase/epimerase family protein [Paenibacillus eucommiae]|uniref:Sugar phosphate isomerase/epimerase n=1 Tax=Paenibacillus eucommiae TaxID=1355755 RepID=A0ABS4IQG6_9BACL|nr:TIM barrel protein [Paenibacillus eucommiae]MBP1989812.1 sugar phosphate isomerase/epimerase [Paenibacillus eucommiae]
MKLGMPSLIEFKSLEQNVRLCHELNLDFIELNMNLPICMPENLDVKALRKIKKEYGIQFTVHLPEELDVSSFHPSIRKGHLERCKEIMEWASLADIRTLNMHLNNGIYFTLPHQKVWINEQYQTEFKQMLYQSYEKIYSFAESKEIDLCIENTGNFHIPFITSALEMLESFENFCLTWDVGHDAKANYEEEAIMMKFEKNIKHMHLHDYNGKSDHQALYSGIVPINERLHFATKHNLKVVIEVKTSESLKESVKQIRSKQMGG